MHMVTFDSGFPPKQNGQLTSLTYATIDDQQQTILANSLMFLFLLSVMRAFATVPLQQRSNAYLFFK